jgi:hypothetical protein
MSIKYDERTTPTDRHTCTVRSTLRINVRTQKLDILTEKKPLWRLRIMLTALAGLIATIDARIRVYISSDLVAHHGRAQYKSCHSLTPPP